MTIEEVFAGFDPTKHEAEVRERWGDDAWARTAARRVQMSADERLSDDDRSLDVNAALRDAAAAGDEPAAASFQALVAAHHPWVTDFWGARVPDRDAYTGLSELCVADERFAASYGSKPPTPRSSVKRYKSGSRPTSSSPFKVRSGQRSSPVKVCSDCVDGE